MPKNAETKVLATRAASANNQFRILPSMRRDSSRYMKTNDAFSSHSVIRFKNVLATAAYPPPRFSVKKSHV